MRVIVDIKAGLGNQLFCYAFGYAVAKKTGSELCIETSVLDRNKIKDRSLEILKYDIPYQKRISFFYSYNPLLKKLKINRLMKRFAIGMGTGIYKEKDQTEFDPGVYAVKKDTYFDGYWQKYQYFNEYRKEIIDAVRLKKKDAVSALEEEIRKTNAVSIHIRRGDYVSVGWELSMQYYLQALQTLKEKVTDPDLVAYVFSDDIDYARSFFEQNVVDGITMKYMDYDNEEKTVLDMYLMSCCRHNIIANSTYSWWGAYLNADPDRVVICPVTGKWNEDFYLPEWIKIKV